MYCAFYLLDTVLLLILREQRNGCTIVCVYVSEH